MVSTETPDSQPASCMTQHAPLDSNEQPGTAQSAAKFLLALGLFGFAGGVTNWLAVKMLFDRVPFLCVNVVAPPTPSLASKSNLMGRRAVMHATQIWLWGHPKQVQGDPQDDQEHHHGHLL